MEGEGDSAINPESGVPYDSIRLIDEIRVKKQQPVIGHELGFGAPCLKCEDACPGLDLHFWRKICKNCRCPPWDHDIQNPNLEVARKIGRLFDDPEHHEKYTGFKKICIDMPQDRDDIEGVGENVTTTFEWIPYNVSDRVARLYMQSLPTEKQPIVGTSGASERTRMMNEQLPSHDQAPEYCDNLTELEKEKLMLFVNQYKAEALGVGEVQEHEGAAKWHCNKCEMAMKPGEVAVFAARAGPNVCWHPRCFVCATCNEMLCDLIYFWKDGKVYCGRHYGNTCRPRCTACDELIFAREYTQAEDCDWHLKHFCCWHCDSPLGGMKYVAKENHPFCLSCYETLHAKRCSGCKRPIAADEQRLSYNEFHWHAVDACFSCAGCGIPLVKKQFLPKSGQPLVFCSKACKSKVCAAR